MSVPSGSIYLIKNALVDRNYSHTIDFKSPSEQLAYWGSLVKYSLSEYSYIRRSRQYINVEKKLEELQDVNYLYYRAREDGKIYYCFVTDKEYLNDNNTTLYFEVDVLQTRMFEYEVKPSYILQEHVDRWDANLKPIYSRTDEGLDYGSEYTIEAGYQIKPDANNEDTIRWFLAICKPNSTMASSGRNTSEIDAVGLVNPYIYFLIPQVTSNGVLFSYNTDSGVKSAEVGMLDEFSKIMATSEHGNFVQQIVKLPYLPFNFKYSIQNVETNDPATSTIISREYKVADARDIEDVRFDITEINDSKFIRIPGAINASFMKTLAEMDWDEGIKDALPTAEQWAEVRANPYTTERDKRFESKLLTYPYRYNLFTDWKNNPVIIKNEYLCNDKIKVNHTQSISFNSPSRYWLEGYKKDPEGRGSSIIQNIPEEAPIITDAYYTYMLQNKNQIQADQTNAKISGTTNTIMGAVNGASGGGGLLGTVFGAIGGAISSGVNAAVGYQNMIRSENAKQRDIKNLPDTIINPNDVNFSYFDNNEWLTFYRYKIACEFEHLLADTFAMSGYTVKRVKVPNLKTRTRYNYVKTVGANIVGSFEQNDLVLLRQIFDNGITFWHYNNVNFKMLDYSLENIETKLLKEVNNE